MPDQLSGNPRRYDVFFSAGRSRLYNIRNPNRGVTIGDDAIGWTISDKTTAVPFGNIVTVRLESVKNGKKVTDQCTLGFTDGTMLCATNAEFLGQPDEKCTPVYRDFVRDLHRRLAVKHAGAIRFSTGMARWRYYTSIFAVIFAALLFIGGPIVILVLSGDMKAFLYMAAGLFLCWPLISAMYGNPPRDYTPDKLPEELLS
jgi:hypothetical protein